MSDLIAALSKVHDNFILSYAVDFQEHTLKLKTQNANGNTILITFDGLLAHHFEHVSQDNILFGIDEISVEDFFANYQGLLGKTLCYGFPCCCSLDELHTRMHTEHLRVFVIDSSLGLNGFVLCKSIQISTTDCKQLHNRQSAAADKMAQEQIQMGQPSIVSLQTEKECGVKSLVQHMPLRAQYRIWCEEPSTTRGGTRLFLYQTDSSARSLSDGRTRLRLAACSALTSA